MTRVNRPKSAVHVSTPRPQRDFVLEKALDMAARTTFLTKSGIRGLRPPKDEGEVELQSTALRKRLEKMNIK